VGIQAFNLGEGYFWYQLVVECVETNVFGRTQIGVEYKLLGLGRGCYADNVCEILGIGNETVNLSSIGLTRANSSPSADSGERSRPQCCHQQDARIFLKGRSENRRKNSIFLTQ